MSPDRATLFRTLGDPNRLRILALLGQEELSVSELQDILGLGQSTVSAHLAQLRRVGLVATRKDGSATRSVLATPDGEDALVQLATAALAEPDLAALDRVRAARVAPAPEGLGPDYLPGRSWEAFCHLLLALLPPLRIADLGVGTGHLTRLLAARARHTIAVDRDPAALAGLAQPGDPFVIEPRLGTLEALPLAPAEVDLVVLSQSLHCAVDPDDTLRQCRRALAPGGRVVLLDLAPHAHEWARHRLDHLHLGFADLGERLAAAGFVSISVTTVHTDRRAPAFTTLLATGTTPGGSP
ncbi:MAG: metalloregulator ArsR/SmtB family transcription factor [Pseudomonadota bacterium]|nr:metalloregulator ArsR/SmtB family transcription factor [Pseudomonadota bacterium]